MSAINDDVWARLTSATFDVALHRGDSEIKVTCRDLPMTTLMAVLGELVTNARDEIVGLRRTILEEISTSGLPADMITMPNAQLMGAVSPIVSALVLHSPKLLERILRDTVIGIQDAHISLFTVDDVLSLVTAMLSRMDLKGLGDKFRQVFFLVMSVMSESKAPEARPETPAPPETPPATTQESQPENPSPA